MTWLHKMDISDTAVKAAYALLRLVDFGAPRALHIAAIARQAGLSVADARFAVEELISFKALERRKKTYLRRKQTLYRLCLENSSSRRRN